MANTSSISRDIGLLGQITKLPRVRSTFHRMQHVLHHQATAYTQMARGITLLMFLLRVQVIASFYPGSMNALSTNLYLFAYVVRSSLSTYLFASVVVGPFRKL